MKFVPAPGKTVISLEYTMEELMEMERVDFKFFEEHGNDEIFKWLIENDIRYFMLRDYQTHSDCIIMNYIFVNPEDAMAFKLRWRE